VKEQGEEQKKGGEGQRRLLMAAGSTQLRLSCSR